VRRLQVHVYTCTAHTNSAHDSLLVIASAQKSMRSTPRYMQTEANGSTRRPCFVVQEQRDASSALVANSLLTALHMYQHAMSQLRPVCRLHVCKETLKWVHNNHVHVSVLTDKA
jgi:hypothetical protein